LSVPVAAGGDSAGVSELGVRAANLGVWIVGAGTTAGEGLIRVLVSNRALAAKLARGGRRGSTATVGRRLN